MRHATYRKPNGGRLPWPYFVAIGMIIFFSTLQPAECDINKNLWTPETYSKLKELGEFKCDYQTALWPSDEALRRHRASLSIVPPDVVENTANRIRTFIKKEWLPTNLDNRLIPMNDWVRRQRFERFSPTYERSSPAYYEYKTDVLIAEFSIKGYNIQIQDYPYFGILISPVKPNEGIADIEGYINNSISTFLNFPPSKLDNIEYMLKHTQNGTDTKIFYGKLTCEWNLDWDGILIKDGLLTSFEQFRHRKWWNSMTVCTDGYFIFLCIRASTPEDYVATPTARIDDLGNKSRF